MSLEVPGKPFPLSRGVYLDVNRNLRRCLKRMGSGSVAQGLKTAKVRARVCAVRCTELLHTCPVHDFKHLYDILLL